MAGWAKGPDGLRHLFEDPRNGIGCLSTGSACGLPELGRRGKDSGDGRCHDCVKLVATMAGEGDDGA